MANRTPADFADADMELAATLDSLAGADQYLTFLAKLIEPRLGERVLEIGAGHGDLTELLAAKGHEMVATDLSQDCLSILRNRFDHHDHVEVAEVDACSEASLAALPPVDSALMVNVLEHIHDDGLVLRRLTGQVDQGGTIVIFVPAFELLYGSFDHAIGHYRRYRAGDMRDLLSESGLEPEVVRYVNAPGFFAWLLTVRLLGQNPTGSALVSVYDRLLVPAISALETRWAPPFGQSILAVGRVR